MAKWEVGNGSGSEMQWQVLQELNKVNTRLDKVEGQVAEVAATKSKQGERQKLSTVAKTKSSK